MILSILSVIGAIGIFIFGMKLMSESLQKIAGNSLRSLLNYVASSASKAIMTGLIITALVQASSVVTVMIVSLVNAGMLTLTQSIAMIMGANIGTTIKLWLIATLSINANMGVIALPLLGISFPLIFSQKRKVRIWGDFFIGLSLLFLGLDFLNYLFSGLTSNKEFLSFLTGFAGFGIKSDLFFLFTGMIITILVQSSSATVALTIVLCGSGLISFETGAAMILGENIGTTVTANIAAIIANRKGKRAALSHTLFNVTGVIWALIFFQLILQGIDYVSVKISGNSPFTDSRAIPLALAMLHTFFNVANTFLLAGFIPLIAKLTEKIIPARTESPETQKLTYFEAKFSTSELLFVEAKNAITDYAKKAEKIFSLIPELLDKKDIDDFNALLSQVRNIENQIDESEDEIGNYITRILQDEVSDRGVLIAKSMQRIIKEIESIGDCTYHMANSIQLKNNEKAWFSLSARNDLRLLFSLINKAFIILLKNLENDYNKVSLEKAQLIELQINKTSTDLLNKHLTDAASNELIHKSGVIYVDLLTTCEKIGDHIFNINEAIYGIK